MNPKRVPIMGELEKSSVWKIGEQLWQLLALTLNLSLIYYRTDFKTLSWFYVATWKFLHLFQYYSTKMLTQHLNVCLFKVNNRKSRKRCEICLKLTIKTPERRHWPRSGVFIINFEQVNVSWAADFYYWLKPEWNNALLTISNDLENKTLNIYLFKLSILYI